MNIRTFLAGAVCGAAAVAAVGWLFLGDRRTRTDGANEVEAESNLRASADSNETGGNQSNEVQYPNVPDASGGSESSSLNNAGADASTTSGQSESQSDTAVQESGERDSVAQDTSYWLEKRRDELISEPKDDSWAYYMEQTLTQFLSSHPAITEFEVSYVECRTTICQIQVIGFDDSTGPTWSRIMFDLRQVLPEPTKEWGMSGYNLEGRRAIVQTIKRGE